VTPTSHPTKSKIKNQNKTYYNVKNIVKIYRKKVIPKFVPRLVNRGKDVVLTKKPKTKKLTYNKRILNNPYFNNHYNNPNNNSKFYLPQKKHNNFYKSNFLIPINMFLINGYKPRILLSNHNFYKFKTIYKSIIHILKPQHKPQHLYIFNSKIKLLHLYPQ
jgi:hypothetical protein